MTLLNPRKPKPVTQEPSSTFEDRLLPIGEVKRALGVKSRNTVYKYIKDGVLPEPVRLSNGAVRWRLSDIQTLIKGACSESQQNSLITKKSSSLQLVPNSSGVDHG